MVTSRLMTADELYALPDDGYQYELVRGELRRMPPPGVEHGEICGRFARPLLNYATDSGLATVLINDTGWWLERDPDTVRGPDVSVVLNDRLPPRPRKSYLTVPPTLVVEVASPGDEMAAIEEKIGDYVRAGVPVIWYVFPETKTVLVDGARRARVILTECDQLDAADVLPGLAPIRIAEILR